MFVPRAVLTTPNHVQANKTVTLEAHPHRPADGMCASVHPCRHSAVMKRIVAQLKAGGRDVDVREYLLMFLKFISSVVPTLNYDHTMGMEAK